MIDMITSYPFLLVCGLLLPWCISYKELKDAEGKKSIVCKIRAISWQFSRERCNWQFNSPLIQQLGLIFEEVIKAVFEVLYKNKK